jgi:hypothetical protein
MSPKGKKLGGSSDLHVVAHVPENQWTERGPLGIRKADGSPISLGQYGTGRDT